MRRLLPDNSCLFVGFGEKGRPIFIPPLNLHTEACVQKSLYTQKNY